MLYVLQINKPRTTFQALATKTHDIEVKIANHRSKSSSSYELKKEKGNSKKSSNPPKASKKEAMTAPTSEHMWISEKSRPKEKKASYFKDTTKTCLIVNELQEKKYHFLI